MLSDAPDIWQGSQMQATHVQEKAAEIGGLADVEDAVHVISAAFTPVPEGAVLWHATMDTRWVCRPKLWLATAASAEGAWLARSSCA